MEKDKVLFVFGTRPEAIKMIPVVKVFKRQEEIITKVCVTAQHRELLDQVLDFFEVKPDYDLDLMTQGQKLSGLTARILTSLQSVIDEFQPDFIYVHGDTSTSFVASLAAFYNSIQVCHVEAGLRTFNKHSPFPEELNRQLVGKIADHHYAPTKEASQNLIKEGVNDENILVTGNTVIDALHLGLEKVKKMKSDKIKSMVELLDETKKLILVTGHRRENFGDGFLNICEALKEIASRDDVQIIYPVHLNPNVQKPVFDLLDNLENVHLLPPMPYESFIWLMDRSYIIITDSGGIQEEAPSLGKPVLVMRDTTERPEAVHAGTVLLVGTNRNKIVETTTYLLNNTEAYEKMSQKHNPYGDGMASQRILDYQLKIKRN